MNPTELDLATATAETFEGHRATRFALRGAPAEAACDLELVAVVRPAVDEFHLETRRRNGIRLEPFNLQFRGPATPRLTQGTVALEHPVLGTFQIFLVPVGIEAGAPMYEAVFS